MAARGGAGGGIVTAGLLARPRLIVRRVPDTAPAVEAEPPAARIERSRRSAAVRVYIARHAMDDIWRSVGRCPRCGAASGRARVERGGALAGRYAVSPTGQRFVTIRDAIPAEEAPASRAHIDIRADDWREIYRRIADTPGCRLLGWYHSQPGFGIRMSSTDLDTQQLFEAEWQVGLVVDPWDGAYRFYRGRWAQRVRWVGFVADAAGPTEPGEASSPGGTAACDCSGAPDQTVLVRRGLPWFAQPAGRMPHAPVRSGSVPRAVERAVELEDVDPRLAEDPKSPPLRVPRRRPADRLDR
jgi:proteasome lid subunit RPN8/RPN11